MAVTNQLKIMKVFLCFIIIVVMFMATDLLFLGFIDLLSDKEVTVRQLAQTPMHIYLFSIVGLTLLCLIGGAIEELHFEIFGKYP